MKCAHPDCNRGIGLISYRRGWFGRVRRYCSRGCRKLRHTRDDGPHRELEDIANAVVFLISPESGWITNLHACVRD
jgi:hypothetical protein